ncbi:hypothetical protein CDD83_7520 [Cordyceps sp. RAO-2017]|nr:hypothetical protein CDD83_7520 [Cordyceps sp. RAO-2017]
MTPRRPSMIRPRPAGGRPTMTPFQWGPVLMPGPLRGGAGLTPCCLALAGSRAYLTVLCKVLAKLRLDPLTLFSPPHDLSLSLFLLLSRSLALCQGTYRHTAIPLPPSLCCARSRAEADRSSGCPPSPPPSSARSGSVIAPLPRHVRLGAQGLRILRPTAGATYMIYVVTEARANKPSCPRPPPPPLPCTPPPFHDHDHRDVDSLRPERRSSIEHDITACPPLAHSLSSPALLSPSSLPPSLSLSLSLSLLREAEGAHMHPSIR